MPTKLSADLRGIFPFPRLFRIGDGQSTGSLHQFPRAAETNHHTPNALKQRILTFSSSGGKESKINMSAGRPSL